MSPTQGEAGARCPSSPPLSSASLVISPRASPILPPPCLALGSPFILSPSPSLPAVRRGSTLARAAARARRLRPPAQRRRASGCRGPADSMRSSKRLHLLALPRRCRQAPAPVTGSAFCCRSCRGSSRRVNPVQLLVGDAECVAKRLVQGCVKQFPVQILAPV